MFFLGFPLEFEFNVFGLFEYSMPPSSDCISSTLGYLKNLTKFLDFKLYTEILTILHFFFS